VLRAVPDPNAWFCVLAKNDTPAMVATMMMAAPAAKYAYEVRTPYLRATSLRGQFCLSHWHRLWPVVAQRPSFCTTL
jgi:hypothetical protein